MEHKCLSSFPVSVLIYELMTWLLWTRKVQLGGYIDRICQVMLQVACFIVDFTLPICSDP